MLLLCVFLKVRHDHFLIFLATNKHACAYKEAGYRLHALSVSALLTWLALNTTALKEKVENDGQYKQYLQELKPLRDELGIELKEDLYPESK